MTNRSHCRFLAVGSILLVAAVISCAPAPAALEDESGPAGGQDTSTMTKDSDDPANSRQIAGAAADEKAKGSYQPLREVMKYYMRNVFPEIAAQDPSIMKFAHKTQCKPDEGPCCIQFFDDNDGLLDWMSRRRLDASAERSCPELYHVWGISGEKQFLTTICRKNSSFSVLSTYREGDMEGLYLNCRARDKNLE